MVSRIKTLISQLGLSTRSFALNCGLRQNTLSNQLNGVRELSLSTISAILASYPEVSCDWLLRGEGEMMKQGANPKQLERISKLSNVVETLQDVIDDKNATITELSNRISQLENQLKSK